MTSTPSAILGRHARAIRILTCLQSGPGFNAEELARHLGVSRRTVYRDLNLIREAGISIHFDERHSAYRLERDAHQHLLPTFEGDDLQRMVLAAHTSILNLTPQLGAGVRDSINKLLCHHPTATRNELTLMMGGCFVHPPEQVHNETVWRGALCILDAIGKRRRVRGKWTRNGEAVEVELAPFRLDVSPHSMMVTGRVTADLSTMTFDLQELRQLTLTEKPYYTPRAARFQVDPLEDHAFGAPIAGECAAQIPTFPTPSGLSAEPCFG